METSINRFTYAKHVLLSVIYALFYTFCLYRNYRGITFPFFVIGTACFFLYFLRESGHTFRKDSIWYLAAIFLLGANVCLTTNVTVIIFDKLFIFLLFFMLFLHNLYDDSAWDVSKYFLSVCYFAASAVEYLPNPVSDLVRFLKSKNEVQAAATDAGAGPVQAPGQIQSAPKKPSPVLYVLIGLGISIPIIALVLPLLISSDAVFSDTLKRIFDFELNFNPVTLLLMIVAVFFAAYMMVMRFLIPAGAVAAPVTDRRSLDPIIAITVNVILSVIYVLYSGIQIVYLFMRRGSLPEGYNYPEYAHEGFFQLVFVCLINIVVVLLCRKYSKDSLVLKLILCLISACTYVMIASSAYRMYLYISVYSLTFLRLYVLWALAVMALVMAGIIIYLFVPGMPFARYAVAVLIGLWIVFAYVRPDHLIASYNIRYHDDDMYICELSFDAVPAIEKYDKSGELLEMYFSTGDYPDMEYDPLRPESRENRSSWRTWNYSLSRAYDIYDEDIRKNP